MGGLRDDASRPLAVPDEHHPIPNCFSCGPANQRGLRIRPRVAGARDVWAAWHPDPRYTGPDGVLPLEVTGAALDCSNAMALSVAYPELGGMRELVPILAAFDMHVLRAPPAAPTGGYRVVARATGVDGRKYHSLSALFAAEGTPYAVADTTWVALPKSDVGYKG
jgi:hypothetical protein